METAHPTPPIIPFGEFLDSIGVTQTELSGGLGMRLPTLNRKVRGWRSWRLEEMQRVVTFLRTRLQDDTLTLDRVFGGGAGATQKRLPTAAYGRSRRPIPAAAAEGQQP